MVNTSDKEIKNKMLSFLGDNEDSLRFVALAICIFSMLQLIYFQFYIGSSLFHGYLRFCAELSGQFLLLIGEPVTVFAKTITSSQGPSVTVVEGCDALRIYSVLIATICAYDASFWKKINGVLFGVGVMFLFNLMRISLLLWLDIHYPYMFDVFHHTILPFGLWMIAVIYFYWWGSKVQLR